MHPELSKKLEDIRSTSTFNVAKWCDAKADALNGFLKSAKLSGCVVSVSGGVDSAVTLALLKHASKKDRSPLTKIIAVAQPIHSTPEIQNRAYEVAEALGAECITLDLTSVHTEVAGKVKAELKRVGATSVPTEKSEERKKFGFADGQLRSYLRTPPAFYVAQVLAASGNPAVVVGTGNKSEDGYLRYFCKAGDGVCDIQLISELYKAQVFAVGAHLGVPKSILVAPPSADLWDGQTDEEELGFSYDFVELWMEYLGLSEEEKTAFKAPLTSEAVQYLEEKGAEAKKIHDRNAHKLNFPHNIICALDGSA